MPHFLNPRVYAALPDENRQPLASHLNLLIAFAHDGGAWAGSTDKSQKALARLQGVTDRTVRRIEARLAEAGLIRVSTGRSGNRRVVTIRAEALAPQGPDTSAAPPIGATEKAGCGQERRPPSSEPESSGADTSAALCGHQRRP